MDDSTRRNLAAAGNAGRFVAGLFGFAFFGIGLSVIGFLWFGGDGGFHEPPIFFKPGDVSVCTYEGIGTLTNPVIAAER